MPAVLTEVGFISNPEEEQYMMSDEGQATIVVSIFKAFVAYKSQTEGTKAPTDLKIDLKGYKSPKKKEVNPPVQPTTAPETAVQQDTPEQVKQKEEGLLSARSTMGLPSWSSVRSCPMVSRRGMWQGNSSGLPPAWRRTTPKQRMPKAVTTSSTR